MVKMYTKLVKLELENGYMLLLTPYFNSLRSSFPTARPCGEMSEFAHIPND
jgi:hypothetical protein